MENFKGIDGCEIYNQKDLNKAPSLEQFKKFFPNSKNYLHFFKEETILKNLKNITLRDVAQEIYVPYENFYQSSSYSYYIKRKGYPLKDNGVTEHQVLTYVKKRGCITEVSINALCYTVLIPKTTFLFEPTFFHNCLTDEYDYLNSYSFASYHFDKEDEDIYIFTKAGKKDPVLSQLSYCFYCPVRALKEKDFKIAYKRHTDYFSDYYNPYKFKTVPFKEVLNWKNIMLGIVKEPELITFKQDVERGYALKTTPEPHMNHYQVKVPVLKQLEEEVVLEISSETIDVNKIAEQSVILFQEKFGKDSSVKVDSSKAFKVTKLD